MSNFISIGSDVLIHPSSYFKRPNLVSIGSHVSIDFCSYFTTRLILGNYIHISSHVSVIGGESSLLRMDDCTNLSTGCRVICSSDSFDGTGLISLPGVPTEYINRLVTGGVHLQRFANVGANVVILPGVIISEGSVVGANSLVTKTTEPWSINVGSPSKKIKSRPKDQIINNYINLTSR